MSKKPNATILHLGEGIGKESSLKAGDRVVAYNCTDKNNKKYTRVVERDRMYSYHWSIDASEVKMD